MRLAQVPVPPDHRPLLDLLQSKLGHGIAPPFPDITDSANMSTFVGGSAVAAEIAGYFEMAVGAGIDTAWANVTADDVRSMLPLIVYQHSVWMRSLPLAQHGHSNLLAHVLRDLHPSSPSGTSIYVGHDRCALCIPVPVPCFYDARASKFCSVTSMDWLRCWAFRGAALLCLIITRHQDAFCVLTCVMMATSRPSLWVLLTPMSHPPIPLPCAREQRFSRTRAKHLRSELFPQDQNARSASISALPLIFLVPATRPVFGRGPRSALHAVRERICHRVIIMLGVMVSD